MTSSAFERRYSHSYHHPHREKTPASPRKLMPSGAKLGAIGAVLVLAVWSLGSAFYILFRDDALRSLVVHQTDIVRSYDSQIAALQTQVQRLQSLKLLEQERIDRTVADLARRQTTAEQRQEALTKLEPKIAREAPPPPAAKGPVPDTFPVLERTPKPSPISDQIAPAPAPQRSAATPSTNFALFDRTRPIEGRLDDLAQGISRIEAQQQDALDRLADTIESSEDRVRAVLLDLGIDPPATRRSPALGGPFIPFLKPKTDPFDQKLAKTQETAASLAGLDQALASVPVRFPVPRRSEITSGFGVRSDPFLHQLALHSGVDFRGQPGELVRATASGRVTNAGFQGGYGLMVEIDHGKGFVTRYGHLSAIEANAGDEVTAGEIIGRIGTTGRSTGPHLHYEVRVSGEAADPMRYLRLSDRLAGIVTAITVPSSPVAGGEKTQLISTD